MNCPRCGSDNLRRSQSQDSVWFRFVLQKKMRCQRCSFAFIAPVWENPVREPRMKALQVVSDAELDAVTATTA